VVAIFSLLYSQSHNNQMASVIVLVFVAAAWMGIQYLGYAEFTFAGRMIFGGDLQRSLRIQMDLHSFERSLGAASSAAECVRLIEESAPRFGFDVLRIQIAGETVATQGAPESAWQVRVPLGGGDFIELVRNGGTTGGAAGLFLDSLRAGVPARLPVFHKVQEEIRRGSEAPVW
jgi:hypothetical protein